MANKHPLNPVGYDPEEAWAHEQNEEAKRKLREKAKAEKEEAEKNKGEAKPEDDDAADKLHHRAYGRHADPSEDDD